MKKLMFAIAAVAAGTVLADVTSANVVGYASANTVAGTMDIAGANFVSVGGTDIDIQEIKVGDTFSRYGEDWIRFYDPATGTYTYAKYFNEVYETLESPEPIPDFEGWADEEQTILHMPVSAGRGLWVKSLTNSKITFAGQVPGEDDGVVSTVAGTMDIVCNPYPVEIDIQQIKVGDSFSRYGEDWIRFYNTETGSYTYAKYFNEVYETLESPDPIPDFEGWADEEQTILHLPVKANQGFWVKSLQNSSLVFPSPL